MKIEGKSVFGGIAMGRLSIYKKNDSVVRRTKVADTAEIGRAHV